MPNEPAVAATRSQCDQRHFRSVNLPPAMATSSVRPVSQTRALSNVAVDGYVVLPSSGLYRHDGPDALDLLHRITTNDLMSLHPGQAVQTVMVDERGRIVDVPWVVMQGQDDLLLITDANDTRTVERAILKYTIIEDACLTPLDSNMTRVKFFGGAVEYAYAEFADTHNISGVDMGDWLSIDETHLLRTEFGNLPSCDLVLPASDSESALGRIATDLPRLSEREFHAHRVAQGVPWPGYELTGAVNPLEAGLRDLIDFDKGCYVGQEVIARLDTYDKVQRSLVELRCQPESNRENLTEPARESDLMNLDGRKIGWLSSSEIVLRTGEWVGLGFVRNGWDYVGSVLETAEGCQLRVTG